MPVHALEKHVYDYTKDVLLKLKRLDLLPEMVQVGNEITNGLMWPHGKWDNVDNIARFISAGTSRKSSTRPMWSPPPAAAARNGCPRR